MSLVSAVLSFIGSLCIIGAILFVRRSSAHKSSNGASEALSGLHSILLWLSICDGIFASAFFLNNANQHSGVCKLQGLIIAMFGLASFLWTPAFAIELYLLIVRGDVENRNRRLTLYHLVSWFVSAVAAFSLLLSDSFGNAGRGWCWAVSSSWEATFIPFYLPLITLWIFCVCIYAMLSHQIWLALRKTDPLQKQQSMIVLFKSVPNISRSKFYLIFSASVKKNRPVSARICSDLVLGSR